jgi:hypothetical protein
VPSVRPGSVSSPFRSPIALCDVTSNALVSVRVSALLGAEVAFLAVAGWMGGQ